MTGTQIAKKEIILMPGLSLHQNDTNKSIVKI
jgi:hypothetical protein